MSADNLYSVAIDTRITPELESEGLARELVRRIQTMRRQADFDIADRIITYYQGDEKISAVMQEHDSYISRETLSADILNELPDEEACTESFKLEGHEVVLGVKRQKS
jgi:isoleucyl-tRNA synthetase